MKHLASLMVFATTFVGMLVSFGCSKQDPSEVHELQREVAAGNVVSDAAASPQDRALKAKDALFQQLSTELMSAMSNGGPAAAISVCSEKATQVAVEVGEEHGVTIGRTSFKLRNPANQPPAWTQMFVEQRVAEPKFVAVDEQTTGAFLPIFMKAQCLTCHGASEQMADDVRDELARRYPSDNATGFEAGELRGWFWVEVPNEAAAIP